MFSSITDSFHSRGTKILSDQRTKKNVGEHHGQQGMNREFWEGMEAANDDMEHNPNLGRRYPFSFGGT